MERIQLPVLFVNPVFKVDGSVKLVFETRELSGVDIAVLADYRQKEGYLMFAANEQDLEEVEIPNEKADPMLNKKTQAQRLRGAIYRVWETKGRKGDFESYYRNQLDYLIESYKEKIDV